MNSRSELLKQKYCLEGHPEGGWFSEVYTSPSGVNERAFMGSIYFLLEKDEVSHFHQIDCDEIWYHHEGCPLVVTSIINGEISRTVIGSGEGQTAMAVIPKGAIFASECLEKDGYCFVSCATTPKFTYDGFRLVYQSEIKQLSGEEYDRIKHLAMPD